MRIVGHMFLFDSTWIHCQLLAVRPFSRDTVYIYSVRREASKSQEVKVFKMQGLANHIFPESCIVSREACSEALTGALIGQPLSRERHIQVSSADTLLYVEGKTARCAFASILRTRRGLRTWHVSTTFVWKPGDLLSDRWRQQCHAARIGKARSRSR